MFYVLGPCSSGPRCRDVRAQVDALEDRLDAENTGRLKWGARAVVTPFADQVFGPVRPALRILWGAVAVLLLIACANVSGLMLTRISRTRHEDGIRLALGATRAAIARLWMCEVVLVAGAGGVLGLAVAHWMTGDRHPGAR